jgi:DNA-binding transcriptional regulator YiaG
LRTLGDHINAKRFEKGLKQGKLAEKLAIPASSVRRWEADLERPSEAEWQTLVAVLGLRPDLMKLHFNT